MIRERGLLTSVVGGESTPTGSGTEDGCGEGQYGTGLCSASSPANGSRTCGIAADEVARAGEEAEDNEEDDETRDPREPLVDMDEAVADDTDQERRDPDNGNPGPAGDRRINGVDKLQKKAIPRLHFYVSG